MTPFGIFFYIQYIFTKWSQIKVNKKSKQSGLKLPFCSAFLILCGKNLSHKNLTAKILDFW